MKKFLLTLVVSLAFCGSIFAQYNSDVYESYWIDELNVNVSNPYQVYDGVVPFMQIEGNYITLDDNYEAMELGAFVNGVCRGHSFLVDDGEEYPITEISVYRPANESGEMITFKLYDHANQILYEDLTTQLANGHHYIDLYLGNYEQVPILNFTPVLTGITLDITPYTSDKDHYYLIASPVGNVNVADVTNMLSFSYDLFAFDQAEDLEWRNYEAGEFSQLMQGKGYLYANSGDPEHPTDVVTLTFPGSPVELEDVTSVGLVYNANAVDFPGWNLVGNPYAVQARILCRPFYLMNNETSELIPMDANEIIPAMAGAFVVAEEEEETVEFTNQTESGVNCDELGEEKLVLNLTNGRSVIDRAIVHFAEGRTLPKFQLSENSTRVYIPVDGQDYAVVSSATEGELPVSFKAESNGTYTLSVNAEGAGFNYLHLIDNRNGADVDLLATPSYTFDAQTSDYASRFRLVFATGSADDTFAFSSNGSWVISNEGPATVQVIDVNGRIMSSETINGSASVNVSAAAGVYMIRLINGDNVKVQKIIVK